MSEIRVVVCDEQGVWSGVLHGSTGDRLIAALGADPTTMAELARSLRQFEHHPLGDVVPGLSLAKSRDKDSGQDELDAFDAGILWIDLDARLVFLNSTYSHWARCGQVSYHNGCYQTDKKLRYSLGDDWKFVSSFDQLERMAQKRKTKLASRFFDARRILYGDPLFHFIADRIQAEIDECGGEVDDYDSIQEIFSDIHIQWLMTERSELHGKSPRSWMVEHLDHIEACLECTRENWSILERPPMGVSTTSHAYSFSGAGYHEWIVYYDYVRHLIAKCWHWTLHSKEDRRQGAIVPMSGRLAWESQRWLHEPIVELSGRTPWGIIDRERQRLPEVNSPEDAIIDCDCPLCVMMAEIGGVSFWYMDDSHMDIDDEYLVEVETTHSPMEIKSLLSDGPLRVIGNIADAKVFPATNSSDFDEMILQAINTGPNNNAKHNYEDRDPSGSIVCSTVCDSNGMLLPLFEFGGMLGELITQLKSISAPQHSIELLMRDWGNLREVLKTDGEPGQAFLIHPVLERFHKSLDEVLELDENLEKHCVPLHQALERFSEVVLHVS